MVRFSVTVSDDAMRVVLMARHVNGSIRLDAADVCKEFAAQNLTLDETVKAKIAALCEQRLAVGAQHTLLAGEPAVAPQPPHATLVEELASARPPFAKTGQRVATITPAEPGRPGNDVFGVACPAAPTPTLDTLIGAGIALDKDQQSLIAKSDGVVHVGADGRISIGVTERVEFDLYTPVPMECATDLLVGGSVKDGTSVNCTAGGCLYVQGALETDAAAVDIIAQGAIRTGHVAMAAGKTISVVARGQVAAGTIATATVQARGDVTVVSEITSSTITCGGRLIAPQATIHASTVLASGAVECRVIGCEDHTRTVIEIGAEPALRKLITELLPQIETRREHVAKVRRTIQPLLADARRLTPEQKERCTELLFDAETTDAEASAMLKRLTDGHDRLIANAGGELTIHELAHPGVIIRFVGVEAALRMTLRGPVVIRAVTDRTTPSIVCKYPKTSQEVPLETRLVPDDPILTLRHHVAQAARRQRPA